MANLKLLVEIEFSEGTKLTEAQANEVAESVRQAIERQYLECGLAPAEMLTENYTVKPIL